MITMDNDTRIPIVFRTDSGGWSDTAREQVAKALDATEIEILCHPDDVDRIRAALAFFPRYRHFLRVTEMVKPGHAMVISGAAMIQLPALDTDAEPLVADQPER